MTKITRTFLQLTDEKNEKKPQQKTKKSKTPEGPIDITVAHQQQPDSQETTSITTSQANKFSKTLDPNTFVLKNSTATSFFKWVNNRFLENTSANSQHLLNFEEKSAEKILSEKSTELKKNTHQFIKEYFHEVTFSNDQIQLDLSQNNKKDFVAIEFDATSRSYTLSLNHGTPVVFNNLTEFEIFYHIFDFKLGENDTASFSIKNNNELRNYGMYRSQLAAIQRSLGISYQNLDFQHIKDETELAVINDIDALTQNSSEICFNPTSNLPSIQNVLNNSLRIGTNTGSATVVKTADNKLRVYSASHVFRDEQPPHLAYAPTGQTFELTIEKDHEDLDLIILSFVDETAAAALFSGVPLAQNNPTTNDFVFTTGYPSLFQSSNQQQLLLSSGFALNIENNTFINTTLPVFQGNSGGGIFWYNPATSQIEIIGAVSGGISSLSITTKNKYDGSLKTTGVLFLDNH